MDSLRFTFLCLFSAGIKSMHDHHTGTITIGMSSGNLCSRGALGILPTSTQDGKKVEDEACI